MRRAGSVLVANGGTAAEEVEVAALIGLQHVVEEEAAVAACEVRRARRHAARRRASSPSGTCSVSVRAGTFSSISSPSRTKLRGERRAGELLRDMPQPPGPGSGK